MTGAVTAPVRPTDKVLRPSLERVLATFFGRLRPITLMTRRPSAYRSSFALENVDVELSTGDSLRLVFKDLGPNALSEAGREAKPPFLLSPSREIEVYRKILGRYGISAPTCYGAVLEPARDRYWLFLERVPGVELYQVGDIEVWRAAARWLARTHATLARQATRLSLEVPLLRYDRRYYETWAHRATAALSGRSRVADATGSHLLLQWIQERHPELVSRLLDLPRTVIHGEFYPSNVLVRLEGQGASLWAIDWDMAAVGPALVDLASLSGGKWIEAERSAMTQAYWEQSTRMDGAPCSSSFDGLLASVQLCRLHLAIKWLGWSGSWTPPPQQAHDWMTEAIHLIERVDL